MKLKLDQFDKKILLELDKNARITTSKIGKKLNRSKQFVDYRIKKLEENKIITKYISVIDYTKLGFQSVRVYFNFQNITPKQEEELVEELIKKESVWWLVTLEGKWHIGYAVAIKNILEFYKDWDNIMKKYRQFISKKEIVTYTHIKQFPKTYLLNKKNTSYETTIGAQINTIPLDNIDKNLLKILSNNAKMPLLKIANKLKTSPQVIKYHQKKLEKNKVILGYRALIDVSHLGYKYYKAYLNFNNTNKLNQLHQYCKEHPNILNLNRTIGGCDFEIELQAKNFEEFDKILKSIRTNFPNMISNYDFVIAREEKKMTYLPNID
jgi:DNA-binding Lrp family transcriptional regulator